MIEKSAKIKSYLQCGYTDQQIATILGIHLFAVEREAARIGRKDSQMDPIRAGWKRVNGGYFSIQQGLPTRR